MNILLFGNSHLAPFKQAWARLATDRPDLRIDFVARPQGLGGLQGLGIADAQLTGWQAPGSGFLLSKRDIQLENYAAFVVIGMAPVAANIGLFSAQLQKSYAAQFLSRTHNAFSSLACLLRQTSPAPIIFVPHPFAVRNGQNGSVENSKPANYLQAVQAFNARWMQPQQLAISPQPIETLQADQLASNTEFQLRPDNAHHLSAAYGKIHLVELLQQLDSLLKS